MSWPRFGMGSVAIADDDTTCPLAVLTCIFGATVLIGPCGAYGEIYRCDAPVSVIPVYTFGIEVPTCFDRWLLLFWVGLKRLIFIKHFYLALLYFPLPPPSFARFKRHSLRFHKLIVPHGCILDALGVEEACIFGMRNVASHCCAVRSHCPCWDACVGLGIAVAKGIDLILHLFQLFGLLCVGIH